MSEQPFLGLTMPVFTAFGWAGEKQAITFALSQLEHFVQRMHLRLSRELQTILPHRGLDKESQAAYLARTLQTRENVYITFHARPLALRTGLHLEDRAALTTAFKTIQANLEEWQTGLEELGHNWELRLQQMEFNPDTNEAIHYKDLYKDSVDKLTAVESTELIDRMLYLNGEDKWLAPLHLTRTMPAEFVAAMSTGVVDQFVKELETMTRLLRLLTGGVSRVSADKQKTRTTKIQKRAKTTSASEVAEDNVDTFTFVTPLKPLHIRRGFVNMTAAHWPFFAVNSRTVTRDVVVRFDGDVDRRSSVWRLSPSDKARLVLGDSVRSWLEDNFAPNDVVQLTATKQSEDIEIELALVR